MLSSMLLIVTLLSIVLYCLSNDETTQGWRYKKRHSYQYNNNDDDDRRELRGRKHYHHHSYSQSNDRNDNRQLKDGNGPEDNKRRYQYSYYQSNDHNDDNKIRQLNDGYIPRNNNDLSSYSYSIDTNPFGTFAILDNTLPTLSPTSKPSEDFINIKVFRPTREPTDTKYSYLYSNNNIRDLRESNHNYHSNGNNKHQSQRYLNELYSSQDQSIGYSYSQNIILEPFLQRPINDNPIFTSFSYDYGDIKMPPVSFWKHDDNVPGYSYGYSYKSDVTIPSSKVPSNREYRTSFQVDQGTCTCTCDNIDVSVICRAQPSSEPSPAPSFDNTNEMTQFPTEAAPTYTPTFGPGAPEPTMFPTETAPKCTPATLPPSPLPSQQPTFGPGTPEPTMFPTEAAPTFTPTTLSPTPFPSAFPTLAPTYEPSAFPTIAPSSIPTRKPSEEFVKIRVPRPTRAPTNPLPTRKPTTDTIVIKVLRPTRRPTDSPTPIPTVLPSSYEPTLEPTTLEPTALTSSFAPSLQPTTDFIIIKVPRPTRFPTYTKGSPTPKPSLSPTFTPTTRKQGGLRNDMNENENEN